MRPPVVQTTHNPEVLMAADVSARLAWPDDALSISSLQVQQWQESFADQLGPEVLESLDPNEMAERWANVITRPSDARMRTLVALTGPRIDGFALVHPSHDPDTDQVRDGEIGEFVISRARRAVGHGSRLLQACADTMRADGFRRAVWWVTSTDDATRGFAESAGWAADGAHRELEGQQDSGERLKQIRLHTTLM